VNGGTVGGSVAPNGEISPAFLPGIAVLSSHKSQQIIIGRYFHGTCIAGGTRI